jgi:hypothetical protein
MVLAKGADQFVTPQTICCTPCLFTSENDLGHLSIRLPQSQLFFIMCGVKLHLEYAKWQFNIMDEKLHMMINRKCQNFQHLMIMWNMKV